MLSSQSWRPGLGAAASAGEPPHPAVLRGAGRANRWELLGRHPGLRPKVLPLDLQDACQGVVKLASGPGRRGSEFWLCHLPGCCVVLNIWFALSELSAVGLVWPLPVRRLSEIIHMRSLAQCLASSRRSVSVSCCTTVFGAIALMVKAMMHIRKNTGRGVQGPRF